MLSTTYIHFHFIDYSSNAGYCIAVYKCMHANINRTATVQNDTKFQLNKEILHGHLHASIIVVKHKHIKYVNA